MRHDFEKSIPVIPKSFVETEALLVEVSEHMKRLNADVGSFNTALQKRPEVLNAVGVNVPTNILFRMTHKGMIETGIAKVKVITVFIGEYIGASFNGFLDDAVCSLLPRIGNNVRFHARLPVLATIQQSKHGDLAHISSAALNL